MWSLSQGDLWHTPQPGLQHWGTTHSRDRWQVLVFLRGQAQPSLWDQSWGHQEATRALTQLPAPVQERKMWLSRNPPQGIPLEFSLGAQGLCSHEVAVSPLWHPCAEPALKEHGQVPEGPGATPPAQLPGNRLSPPSWHHPCWEFSPYRAGGCLANPPLGTAQGRGGPGEQTGAFWGEHKQHNVKNLCTPWPKPEQHPDIYRTVIFPFPKPELCLPQLALSTATSWQTRGKKGISEHSLLQIRILSWL